VYPAKAVLGSVNFKSKHKVPPSYSRLVKARARLTAVGMTSYKKFTLTLKLLKGSFQL